MTMNEKKHGGMDTVRDVRVIAFDADDTLWVNEPMFRRVEHECLEMLGTYAAPEVIRKQLFAVEQKNIRVFGYGIKGFILSLLETALAVGKGRVSHNDLQRIMDYGQQMLAAPVVLLEGIEGVLETLCQHYRLMVITKGDLVDQESKMTRSNLAPFFDHVEILSEKDEAAYGRVLGKHGIAAHEFMMVGNSLRSDILPVVNIGATAVHVPFETTWAHEDVCPSAIDPSAWITLSTLADLPECLCPANVADRGEKRLKQAEQVTASCPVQAY